jgi:excisionase family DNA binding protein
MTEPYLTVREAAAILKISPKTLYKLTASRTVPFTRPGGGKAIRFTQAHLAAIAEAGEQPVIAAPIRLQVATRRGRAGRAA